MKPSVELIAVTPEAERVIESAGRTAYLSFDKETDLPIIKGEREGKTKVFRSDERPGLAAVQTGDAFDVDDKSWRAVRVWRNSAEKFVEMLVRVGHLSVLEHVSATFRIRGGSRAFTHQLVRHRMASFTQQSQRYVDEEHFRTVTPPAIEKHPQAKQLFQETMSASRSAYHRLQAMGIRNEDARFVLPNAVESEIVITTDFREWRHIIGLRGVSKAQWEIRHIAVDLLRILKREAPAAFFDFEVDEEKGVIIHTN